MKTTIENRSALKSSCPTGGESHWGPNFGAVFELLIYPVTNDDAD